MSWYRDRCGRSVNGFSCNEWFVVGLVGWYDLRSGAPVDVRRRVPGRVAGVGCR